MTNSLPYYSCGKRVIHQIPFFYMNNIGKLMIITTVVEQLKDKN
ncbi:hypothetical protein N9N67_02675 [Bacteriovoracaceae bacterium]|nr:hypothetical protein [Bacteriovoracaceae bacterium]